MTTLEALRFTLKLQAETDSDVLCGHAMTILAAIVTARHNYEPQPSMREFMELTGIESTNGVVIHLKRLAKFGLIERQAAARTTVPTCQFIPAERR